MPEAFADKITKSAYIHLGPGVPYITKELFEGLLIQERGAIVKIYLNEVFRGEAKGWEPLDLLQWGYYTELKLVSSTGADLQLASVVGKPTEMVSKTKESCTIL